MDIGQKVKNAMKEGGIPLLLNKSRRLVMRRFGWMDRSNYFFSHKMPNRLSALKPEMEMKEIEVMEKDVMIAKRILVAFHKAVKDGKGHGKPKEDDVWDFAERTHQNDFHKALESNDPHRVAESLSRVYQNGITYGISNAVDYTGVIAKGALRNYEAALIKDRLVSFAELLNILPFEGPEQGAFGKNIQTDSAQLVTKIEQVMGISIIPPDVDGGLLKLKLGHGYFDSRDIFSLYTAWRISQLVQPKHSSICEIGAGVGKVALYANRLGFFNYSIFDIPQMNVVQAWYLIKALPDREVVLYGETPQSRDSVKILPPWEFEKVNNKEYDLTLNEDSFPEIAREIVLGYLNQIKKNTKQYLLSINQEGGATSVPGTDKRQLVAPKVIEACGGFKRIYRFPFMLRRGYAEELYEVL